MKRISFFLITLCFFGLAFSQSSHQRLVEQYLNNRGAFLIGSWSHPTCTVKYSSVVEYANNVFLVTVYFKDASDNFHCDYRLDFSSYGSIKKFENYKCNSPDLASCFDACDFSKYLIRQTINDIKNEEGDISKFVQLVGKTLEEFTCEDACFARVYVTWDSGGYKSYW